MKKKKVAIAAKYGMDLGLEPLGRCIGGSWFEFSESFKLRMSSKDLNQVFP